MSVISPLAAKIILLPHQGEFIADHTTKHLALISGYGAGKTFSFCHKAIDLARRNVGSRGLLLEPNAPLLHDILIPDFEEALRITHTKYTLKKTPNYNYTLHFKDGDTVVMLRSFENWERLIGINAAFIGVDEIDTVKEEIATKGVQKLQGRLRSGKVRQLFFTTTPEGFKWAYKFFEKNKHMTDRRIIRAKTIDNIFLPSDFIKTLKENYPAQLLEAYMNGRFVNLAAGTVYKQFEREQNDTKEEQNGKEPLYIGLDFNVGKMSAAIGVFIDSNLHIVEELKEIYDTPAMIRTIQEKYGRDREIHIYPDGSGDSRKSVNASTTDLKLLKDAGFKVHAPKKNPPVRDRVVTVNTNFINARGHSRLYVNVSACPVLVEGLEQQAYDKNGEPDKHSGVDHILDALGYLVMGVLPIKLHRRFKKNKDVRSKYDEVVYTDALSA